jgi:hypothetical protein
VLVKQQADGLAISRYLTMTIIVSKHNGALTSVDKAERQIWFQ